MISATGRALISEMKSMTHLKIKLHNVQDCSCGELHSVQCGDMNSITRFRVSGNYRGINAGSWEINAWLDAERAAACVARKRTEKENEMVRIVSETRLPSGRWGKRTIETYEVAA